MFTPSVLINAPIPCSVFAANVGRWGARRYAGAGRRNRVHHHPAGRGYGAEPGSGAIRPAGDGGSPGRGRQGKHRAPSPAD